jgi:hypothetical protein
MFVWRSPLAKSCPTSCPCTAFQLFRVDDFDMALKRARALVARFEEEPHVNPNTQTREFSLRDPDGYYVTISAVSARQRRAGARRRLDKGLQATEARGRIGKPPERRSRLHD